MRIRRRVALVSLAVLLASMGSAAPGRTNAPVRDSDVEVVGVFVVGAAISGAALHEGFLYITTSDRLSIYDVSNSVSPRLVGLAASPRSIYGELISTNGERLLLNYGIGRGTLDVWNVEDKTNPRIESTIYDVYDEHVSCLLNCSWIYGSLGTIIELGARPDVHDANWLKMVKGGRTVHRIDEFRMGFMASAPRGGPMQIIDARLPLKPRSIAAAKASTAPPGRYLYTTWPRAGRDRFLISSGEMGECNEDWRGALTTFDTRGWPAKKRFPQAGTYRYQGRTDSDDEGCSSYYFSIHPEFKDGGLVLLPNGLEGTRIVSIGSRGTIKEIETFVPVISDVWLAFWIDEEIFYALNTTGEVYILRYRP